jgi:hypothetical protein
VLSVVRRVTKLAGLCLAAGLIAGCASGVEPSPGATTAAPVASTTPAPTASTAPTAASTDQPTPSEPPAPSATPGEIDWQTLPVVPAISQHTIDIYQKGLSMGRDPHSFSVIGECESEQEWYVNGVRIDGYLAGFDDPAAYRLGYQYAYLQATIDNFMPGFTQPRVAAQRGMNAPQVLSPLYSDPNLCDPRESPLACEIRRNNPSIMLISMETWFYDRPITTYETYLRQIVEYAIDQGVVPVLVTAADNHGYSRDIDAILAKLAQEYDIPLWNFWAAVQGLPNGGVEEQPDANGFKHLTWAANHFDDPEAMQHGWPVRNLTGLEVLDAVWRAGAGLPPSH